MALTAEQKRAWINEHIDADLQHVFNECGVREEDQYNIGQHYKSTLRFSTLADSRADLRQAVGADFGLDANTPGNRAALSAIVAAWESSKHLVSEKTRIRSESKQLGLQRQIPHAERTAMIRAVEAVKGSTLSDPEIPSPEYVAQSLEMIESDEPTASPLDEITSKSEATVMSLQTSVDASGRLKINRQKAKGSMPTSTEEMRSKLKIECNAWLMLASKLRNKKFLHGLTQQHFDAYIEYLLGPKCYRMEVPTMSGERALLKPPWTVMINYEFEMRKHAIRESYRKNKPLRDLLTDVTKDSELKELFFTTPIAVSRRGNSETTGDRPTKWQRISSMEEFSVTKSKGAGKGKSGKGRGKAKKRIVFPGTDIEMVNLTPDGRQICYAYNTGKCDGRCGRIHICRAKGCNQKHPIFEHPGCTKGGA